MKRIFCFVLTLFLVSVSFVSCTETEENTVLYVYNWGEYISDGSEGSYDVNREFERLTGIKVVYETFDSNESMYTKLKAGGASYDVVIPSDYMIDKLISEDMLAPINFDKIPNYKYIGEEYMGFHYYPDDTYSVQYTFGSVGIVYETTEVAPEDVLAQSWSLLFNEKYKGEILQFNNPRDAFATAQFSLGLDVNSTDTDDWDKALEVLKTQKSILQGYVMDEIFNKMQTGEAAIAPYYVGDFFTMYSVNENLAFYHPREGTNFFVDAMCIPKSSKNQDAAALYINFLLDPEVARANAEYICYGCPHSAVYEDPEYIAFLEEELHPDAYSLLYEADVETQVYVNMDLESTGYMNSCWEDLKTQDGGGNTVIYVICIVILAAILALFAYQAVIKYKRRIID
ncbi:MAG: ABC transporter substrate-binding protein [Clostridia bacterium]|nr:ABC transporter substrate-binding protein [Clostridia bacterium]